MARAGATTEGVSHESTSYTTPFVSVFEENQDATISCFKMGRLVMINISGVSALPNGGENLFAYNGQELPAAYLPASSVYKPITVIRADEPVAGAGKVEIKSDGQIRIYSYIAETPGFGLVGDIGWQSFSVSYYV